MTKNRERLAVYFADLSRQRKLKIFTFAMFLALMIEKLLSGATAAYMGNDVHFYFSLSIKDVICAAIYLSTAFMLAVGVEYKYLLIPDFVLFAIKGFNIISGVTRIVTQSQIDIIAELSVIESIVESFLFAMFLLALFAGKLSHGKILPNFPVLCLRLLIFCFPVTVIFEIVKLVVATELHQYPFIVCFNFAKGVLNEAFLDLPYFLLVLTVCFTGHSVLSMHSKAGESAVV